MMQRTILRAALGLAFVVSGCAAPADVDSVLLVNARLVDGTGAAARDAAVRILNGRIAEVGDLAALNGEAVVDLEGLVLAPGFIDTHSHHEWGIFERLEARAAVSQGITTVIVGSDGGSRYPLADFYAALEETPPAVNFASYSGHNTVRAHVLGDDFRRPATDEEIAQMEAMVRADMEAGALGLSAGLEYDPGIYSDPAEVIELASVAAEYGGRYISHIRSEDRYFEEAINEIIEIGRQAGLPVQVSHIKLAIKSLWGEAARFLAKLDAARAEGIDITADIYPYPYWQSTLTVLFPARDFEDLVEARRVLNEIVPADGVLVTTFAPEPDYAGKTLTEIAALRGEEPAVALLALIHQAEEMQAAVNDVDEEGLNIESMIGTSMIEPDIEALMRWPHTNFCTDGALAGAHPRGFGSYTRVLGRYVRERGVMSLEEAVHKASGLAADHMGLSDRGRIAPGMWADLVAFDPETVIDRATTDDPQAASLGISRVSVNGELVQSVDGSTDARPGKVLRRASSMTE